VGEDEEIVTSCWLLVKIFFSILEGYGRRRYKPEFIKFLTYAQSSCDETTGQLEMIIVLYPNITEFPELLPEYENLGKKINSFLQYVETNWKT
jgi:four helix bundle protein